MTTSSPTVAMVPVAAIQVDPGRFQFRVCPSPSGTTGRLSGCAIFRQELAGVLLIWRDPEGIDWLADGHHRLALARRCGMERVAALYLMAANAAEARAQAAAANIAQGSAGPQEVARFLRDAGADRSQLTAWGISPRSPLLRDALPLVELEPSLFAKAATGELELAAAIALAGAGAHPAQLALWREAKRRGWKAERISEAVELARGAAYSFTPASGWPPELAEVLGDWSSDLDQRLAIRAAIRRLLRLEHRAFGVAAAARSAAILEDSGAAVIDRATATDGRGRAALVANAFSLLANRPGPLADLIGTLAAQMIEEKATAAVVVGAAMGDVREAIRRQLNELGVPGE